MNEDTTQGQSVPNVNIETSSSIFDRIIEGVVGRVLSNADAKIVYGEPVHRGERTVIPVARISTGFGFGGGAGQGPVEGSESQGGGSGGGGGGKINAVPVGFIEVTPDASKFVPIQDTTAIAVRVLTLFGIAAIILALGVAQKLRPRE